ncbi:hypothetical protein V5O48_018555 [Marasmius crinis-equi]|uniref:Uncharacterized protein n=1 Tax=Marasmius crinis-equi TaxID=585013 RepID=A0ABR3EKV5_9AGAR
MEGTFSFASSFGFTIESGNPGTQYPGSFNHESEISMVVTEFNQMEKNKGERDEVVAEMEVSKGFDAVDKLGGEVELGGEVGVGGVGEEVGVQEAAGEEG